MKSVSKHTFAALWVLCSQLAIAQEYPFIKYTPKDGLVSSRVQNFYQDSRGRIFFMTGDGLSLYDGARFLNYSIENGLANPIVNDVLEITPDSILVATNTNVLNAWVKGAIKTIKTRNGFCPVINNFYRNKENVVYVATDEGIFRLDKDIFIPLRISHDGGELTGPFTQILEIGDYFLIKKFDGKRSYALVLANKNKLTTSTIITGMGISCVLPVQGENLLLVIVNNKLMCFDLDALRTGILKQKELPPRYLSLRPFVLVKILVDRNNNIWALTDRAILRCKPNGQIQSFDRSNGLDLKHIYSIAIDRENILWILTDGSGVVKLVNNNVSLISAHIGKLPANITAIYSEDSGNVWMYNAEDTSLYRYNNKDFKKWKLDLSVYVGNMSMRKGNILLLGENKIFEVNPSNKNTHLSVKKIYHPINDSIYFLRAETDKTGNIYVPGVMLTIITPSGQVFTTELPGFIDWITFDQQQQLWAVTRNGHLLCFQLQVGLPGSPLALKFHDTLDIDNPRSIVVDKTGKIWIGTRYSGLYCLEYDNRKLVSQRHWSTKELLSDNFIYFLSCDKNNVIWAGTQSGLDKISNSGNVVESISRNNNIYQMIHKIQIDMNNDIWAVGQGSVIRVGNENPDDTDYQPQLQIIRMIAGDKILDLPAGKTVLPSETRQVTIEVAAPSFIDEKRIAYSYRLDGDEEGEWSSATTQASFHLINLQPGEYTLHINAFFPVSRYKSEQLIYHFIILPPWWDSWWFYLLLVAAFITTLILLIRIYYRKKLQRQEINFEKQRAIELERTRIAMEMHDDLGSGLTSIRYLATGLTSSASSLVKEKAIKIESSAKQLVDSLNDIVWTMKSDNNNLSDTLNYIRKQAAEVLESVGMDYHLDFPRQVDEIKLTNDQKRNLILISKEAVHNAIKHSNATSLTITVIRGIEHLRITYSDNGKGFSHELGNFPGNGLLNMQRRATEINATIDIVHDAGTTVTLTMKLI